MSDIRVITVQIPRELIQYRGWFLTFGIGLVVLGIAAVARRLLLIASGIEIAQAVMVGH